MAEKHNKFIDLGIGDLKNVVGISITDEQTEIANMEEKDKPKKNQRLYDRFKEMGCKVIPFTTTCGNYDPDCYNWYAVINNISPATETFDGEDVLLIVRRNQRE